MTLEAAVGDAYGAGFEYVNKGLTLARNYSGIKSSLFSGLCDQLVS